MNPKEKQAAAKLVNIVHGAEIVCPMCLIESGLQPVRNSYQLRCDSCRTIVTFYIQEKEEKKPQIPESPPTNPQPIKRNRREEKLVPFLSVIEEAKKRR
jgi:hypothetical protein